MADVLKQLIALWTEALPEAVATESFRRLYAETIAINGNPVSIAALVQRARAQQAAFSDLQMEVLDSITTPKKIAVAFRQRGRHTGALTTPLGEIPATGRMIDRQVSDLLTLNEAGLITSVRVVPDELGLLLQLDALALKAPSSATR